jgi:hypothetical protein
VIQNQRQQITFARSFDWNKKVKESFFFVHVAVIDPYPASFQNARFG